jgi:polygalacturonase
MRSDVSLYLAPGAVLRGTGKRADYEVVNPRAPQFGISQRVTTFIQYEEGASNVRIWGRGTLDANGEALYDDPDGDHLRVNAIRPNKGSGIIIDGPLICHSRWWTVTPHQCDNVRIRNVKVLNTEFRRNPDGINVLSCQNVRVEHCFVYANDDSMCVKPCTVGNFTGIIEPPDESVRDVVFEDIVTYGRCHAAKVGLQGSTPASDIWFRNIRVLQARNGIAIQHYQGNATMEDIHFVDIHVEDLVYKAHKPYPIRFHIRREGNVRNVEVRDVTFLTFGDGDGRDGYNGQDSVIIGKDSDSAFHNISFHNLFIAGKVVTDCESGHIDCNEFVSGVTFSASGRQDD